MMLCLVNQSQERLLAKGFTRNTDANHGSMRVEECVPREGCDRLKGRFGSVAGFKVGQHRGH